MRVSVCERVLTRSQETQHAVYKDVNVCVTKSIYIWNLLDVKFKIQLRGYGVEKSHIPSIAPKSV